MHKASVKAALMIADRVDQGEISEIEAMDRNYFLKVVDELQQEYRQHPPFWGDTVGSAQNFCLSHFSFLFFSFSTETPQYSMNSRYGF